MTSHTGSDDLGAAGTGTGADRRRYDLDALRAFAMLLGIVLHATLSFIPGFWPIQDRWAYNWSIESNPFVFLLLVIHGFRMQVFFLLSGFFTMMLARRRGLAALLWHRFRRIALPLAAGMATIGVLINWLSQRAFEQRFGAAARGTRGLESWVAELHHMWFLWFLLWMVAGFVLLNWLLHRWRARDWRQSSATGASFGCRWLLALPLVSLAFELTAELVRGEPAWGPDTSVSLWPNWVVLGYYAAFFAFGAVLYGARSNSGDRLAERFGRRLWWPVLGTTMLIVGPVGLWLTYEGPRFLGAVVEVAHTWGFAYGLMGLFAVLASKRRRWVRWASDSSYWIYLIHLPLVLIAADVVNTWAMAPAPKFWLVVVSVTAVSAVSYATLVRHTPVGWLLNGRRPRSRSVNQPNP